MRNNKFLASLALGLALTASGSALAQAPSGSQLFQIGSEATISAVAGSAVSFTVPVAGKGVYKIVPNESGSDAITLLGGEGAYTGPGIYVITDGSGNVVTIVIDGRGKIASITKGDTTKQ